MKELYLRHLASIIDLNERDMLTFEPCSKTNNSEDLECKIFINHAGQNMPANGISYSDVKEYLHENTNSNYEQKNSGFQDWLERSCFCESSPENIFLRWYITRALPSVYVILVILGLIANLVVFQLTYQLRQRHVVDVYVISLAAADGLLLVSVIPSIVEQYYNMTFPFGVLGCKLTSFFTYICMICTRFSIVILALDRFIAVRWPMSGRNYRSVKFGVYLCIGVWIFSVTLSIFALLDRNLSKQDDNIFNKNGTSCVWDLENWRKKTPHAYTIFFIARTAITFYIPGALLILFYLLIVLTLVQNQEPAENGVSSLKILKRKIWRTTKVILAVLSSAILCGTPNAIINIILASKFAQVRSQKTLAQIKEKS
ncbi:Oidioi.mRNA.OKI2018_I69.chr2.g7421.t2.cds [Oikopleura dioica]|uniref:Oidioi.mRNA.OKI2018_I69.chr2.g7421.t2.cds n=1 Tax=Oikopleura dioica TaxID=34765 RepID=A0ABN7TCL9_OIKDI|nr:Oidioi.mRNA.OKI2018_I69.chr2.g7421.t2.cds [Oikopleura dioica]